MKSIFSFIFIQFFIGNALAQEISILNNKVEPGKTYAICRLMEEVKADKEQAAKGKSMAQARRSGGESSKGSGDTAAYQKAFAAMKKDKKQQQIRPDDGVGKRAAEKAVSQFGNRLPAQGVFSFAHTTMPRTGDVIGKYAKQPLQFSSGQEL